MTRITLAAIGVLLAGPAWAAQIPCPDQIQFITCDDGVLSAPLHAALPEPDTLMGPGTFVPGPSDPPSSPKTPDAIGCAPADIHCNAFPPIVGDGSNAIILGPISHPSGITIGYPPHEITLDLDKGTVDLHGAKVDDAAKAFWDAVQDMMGRRTETKRTYTLDEIDRMRAAVWRIMMMPPCQFACSLPSPDTVEQMLRTYMAAGISPEELEKKAAQ